MKENIMANPLIIVMEYPSKAFNISFCETATNKYFDAIQKELQLTFA